MRQYDSTKAEDEILLLQWWSSLVETNELHTVFDARYERVSEFLIAFRQDVLLIETDDKGIWGAFWFDRSPFAGAFFSLWLRRDHRQSRASLTAISEALGIGFHDLKFNTIIVVTQEPTIAKLHQKYGFRKLGVIPGLCFGVDAIVSFMTDDMFDEIAGTVDEAPMLNGAAHL